MTDQNKPVNDDKKEFDKGVGGAEGARTQVVLATSLAAYSRLMRTAARPNVVTTD